MIGYIQIFCGVVMVVFAVLVLLKVEWAMKLNHRRKKDERQNQYEKRCKSEAILFALVGLSFILLGVFQFI